MFIEITNEIVSLPFGTTIDIQTYLGLSSSGMTIVQPLDSMPPVPTFCIVDNTMPRQPITDTHNKSVRSMKFSLHEQRPLVKGLGDF